MKKPVIRFLFDSGSIKGDYHTVNVLANGSVRCDCYADRYNKSCHHLDKVENIMSGNGNQYELTLVEDMTDCETYYVRLKK